MSATAPAIEIRDLYKVYGLHPKQVLDQIHANPSAPVDSGHVLALSDINLSIAPGKICVIMGLSGSGKSTLLRCINRLIEPTGGAITVGGRAVLSADTRSLRQIRLSMIGMVFQHFALLPHMSVVDNVALGLRIAGVPRKERRARAYQTLKLVGLDGWGDRKPSNLSGGMRQRVGLARALVMDTPILLMDEPFSALDPLIREELQQELLRLQTTLNKTIVFVTHDPNEAATIGDHIVILLKGKIVQQGSPRDIVLAPATDYVRDFIRGVDIFKVLNAERAIDSTLPALTIGEAAAGAVTLLPPAQAPMAVTDQGGRLLGIAARPPAPGATEADWMQRLTLDCVRIKPETLIAPYLQELSAEGRPLVVEHADGRFAGMVTKASLLKALAAYPSLVAKQVAENADARDDARPGQAAPSLAAGAARH
jgi:glycine betaine/proline transport system ATP-binding protein